VVVHPPLPSTTCFDQPEIPDAALVSDTAMAAWLGGEGGRHFLRAGREAGHDCFVKLMAVGAEKQRWAADDLAAAAK
jgi:hypothetical protein